MASPQRDKLIKKTDVTVSQAEVRKLVKSAQKFYDALRRNPQGRYRSWEHCYGAFCDAIDVLEKGGKVDVDYLSLMLAFYLASWGMYRGSSFVLQRDYTVHVKVVRILLREKYRPLLGLRCCEFKDKESRAANLLGGLIGELKKHYKPIRDDVVGMRKKPRKKKGTERKGVSDVLITKVLMGTLGCTPAYDRYFVETLKKLGFTRSKDVVKSVEKLARFYVSHQAVFNPARRKMKVASKSGRKVPYPEMKFLDMMFWQKSAKKDVIKA